MTSFYSIHWLFWTTRFELLFHIENNLDRYFVKMCFILGQNDDSKSHWIKKASLVDSRTSVTDVKFGPRHLGLLLATCSADGTVRIYEAPDVMNLSQWSLQHEIQCNLPCRYVRSTYIQFYFLTRDFTTFDDHVLNMLIWVDLANSNIIVKSE